MHNHSNRLDSNMIQGFVKKCGGLSLAVAIASTAYISSAQAQLEEVVVTARKRAESLQDIPVSVLAVSGESIQEQGIVDIQAMSASIPNFSYAQAPGASDVLIMRGLGTVGSGPHLEQAVGQVFNGFFTTRSRMGRAALVDLSQVEVLRGPQGPVIGKNTTLGAINIRSNKPTDELEVGVSGGWDFEASEGYELQAVVSGPFSDTFRGRLVVNTKDKDGWVENQPTGDDHQTKEDTTARLILEANLFDNMTAEFMWQNVDFDRVGKPRELESCANPDAVAAISPGEDCKVNAVNNHAAVLSTGEDVGEMFTLESDLYGLTLNWEFENFTLSSLTGYLDYDMFDQFDSSLQPAGSRVVANEEIYDQFSQEIRAVSSGGEVLDYIVGMNYFSSDLDFTQDFDNQTNRRRHEVASVETDSLSVFGQVDWHLSDAWDLTLGLRYTDEEREGFKDQWQNDYATDNRNDALCGPEQSGLVSCFDIPLQDDIDESAVSWNSSLQWKYSDDSMLYLSAASGFKSSGFDIRQNVENAATASTFVYDDEESVSIEFGGKHEVLDGAMRFNWTIYHTEIDGLQLSANDPVNLSSAVVNGEAHATGVEFDLAWAPNEALTLGLIGAINETEYDEFLSNCYTGQTEAEGCDVDANGDGQGDFQDLSGEQPPYAPDMTIAGTASYAWAVGSSMEMVAYAKVYYVDDQLLAVNADPTAFEDSYTKVDASLSLSDMEGIWKVSLVGRNLTDEIVRSWSEGTTAFNVVGGARYSFIDETRAIALRFQYNFR